MCIDCLLIYLMVETGNLILKMYVIIFFFLMNVALKMIFRKKGFVEELKILLMLIY